MKKRLFTNLTWFFFGFVILLTACQKDDPQDNNEDPQPEPVNVTPPCEIDQNTTNHNLIEQSYYEINIGTSDLSYGEWGFVGHSFSSDLRIQFAQEVTESGIYITTIAPNIEANEVIVSGTFSNQFCYGQSGDTVYVEIIDDSYSASFCDLTFSTSVNSNFFTTSGNLNSIE